MTKIAGSGSTPKFHGSGTLDHFILPAHSWLRFNNVFFFASRAGYRIVGFMHYLYNLALALDIR